jgi:uncharacterized hydrophobic protein (TIGR00271 family)
MRYLMVKVPAGAGEKVLETAGRHSGQNMLCLEGRDAEDKWETVFASFNNREAGKFMKDLEKFDKVQVTFFPHDVLTMMPPQTEVSEKITDVLPRSPMEVWLNGLQSIGSWKGFFGYAISAAIVAWIAMLTNTIYLLVAAMILAPFAGPAMNIAIATATGDSRLLWRNLLRYFTALTVTVVISFLLSLLLQLEAATTTMVSVSEVSTVAVLLPLVAGAAGAINLIQAESNSLVSGTAVGLLVAASLAPPSALIGMAGSMERWDLVGNGAFILALQLVGINLGGTIVFRFFGLKTEGQRYERGRPVIFYLSMAVSMVLLAGLLVGQFATTPDLQRSTREQRAASEIQDVVEAFPYADLIHQDVRFPRPKTSGLDVLLGSVYVQRTDGAELPGEEIQQQLRMEIQRHLLQEGFNITPLMEVIVLEPPPR